MAPDTFSVTRRAGVLIGCIDLVESPDDGGWYAQQYDFERADSATRTSTKIYETRASLIDALARGRHRWKKWS